MPAADRSGGTTMKNGATTESLEGANAKRQKGRNMALQERVALGEGCYRRRSSHDDDSITKLDSGFIIEEERGTCPIAQQEELLLPGFAGGLTTLPIIADLSSDDHMECSECKGATMSFVALCAKTFRLKFSEAIRNTPFINVRRFERWKVATKACEGCDYSWDAVMARMSKSVEKGSSRPNAVHFDPHKVYGDAGNFMSGRTCLSSG